MSELGYQIDFLGDAHIVDLSTGTAEGVSDVLTAQGLRQDFRV